MIIDVHSHILPYVDDGSENMRVALELLQMETEQGVTEICLTPHLREGMFPTEDEKLRHYFSALQQEAKGIPVRLHLSREYFFDFEFQERLKNRQLLPMGKCTLLVEFSSQHSFDKIYSGCREVLEAGYTPLIAHLERYNATQADFTIGKDLVELGAKIQINSDGILGREGFRAKRACKYLLENRLVFAVASDTHDTQFRAPKWEKCRKKLERKYGEAYTDLILHRNPQSLLYPENNKTGRK